MAPKKEIEAFYEIYDDNGCAEYYPLNNSQITGKYKEVNGQLWIEYNSRSCFLGIKWYTPIWISEKDIVFTETKYYDCKVGR